MADAKVYNGHTPADCARSTGLPETAVERLVSALGKGVGLLRSEHRDRAEEVLATQWRAAFHDRAGHLDEPRPYLLVAEALTDYLDAVSTYDPSGRAQLLAALANDWRPAMLGVGRPDANEQCTFVVTAFGHHGMPPPPPADTANLTGCLTAAIFGVVEPIRALHQSLGGGELTDPALRDLVALSLAAHALNAPETIWAAIDAAQPAAAQPASDNLVTTPGGLARVIVGTELRARGAIAAAENRRDKLRAADQSIQDDLRADRLSPATATQLGAVGISTEELQTMLSHQHRFAAASLWKKIILGSARRDIDGECDRIRARWRKVLTAADAAVDTERNNRTAAINGLGPLVEPFEPGPGSRFPEILRPRAGYVGNAPHPEPAGAESELSGRLHTLWSFRVLEDRDWTLPELTYTHPSVLIASDGTDLPYEQACRAVRDMILEKMSRLPPRRLRLTWIDPMGRGQSAGAFLELLEVDKELLDEKVWSEPDEITAALRRISDQMAYLEQRCLKDTYPDLDSYNRQAGSLAEPFQVVAVTGFPRGFTEDSAQRLRQISEQGSRLGVSVLLVTDPAVRPAFSTRPVQAHGYPVLVTNDSTAHSSGFPTWWHSNLLPFGRWVFGHKGKPHAPMDPDGEREPVWVPCTFPAFAPEAAGAIVEGYGKASESAANVVIDSAELVADRDELPAATTATSLDIPIGKRGRGNVVELELGKGLLQNVLVGGLPGSGKSSLFHTMITNAARRYAPDELEMYLLDFKQGVEFQPYANGALPHAKVVAVQSEREFGLSVLRGLKDLITSRSSLFKAADGGMSDNLAEYRERTGASLPRVLVVIDEFQVMFADDDQVAHECAQLLDHVVRQGRAYGLHTVLGTQTLRGHGAMSLLRGTLDQVAVRVVLKTSDADSRLFLADNNPAGARLTRPGEAIFNPDGGQPEGNIGFQVALTTDETRDSAIARERRRADAAGFTRRPLVFDGTREITVADDEQVGAWITHTAAVAKRSLRLHLGQSVAIGGSGAVELSRRAGRHLLVVHRETRFCTGGTLVGLITAVHSCATTPRVVIVECLGDDEDDADRLRSLAAWRGAVTWGRRRKLLATALADGAAEVRRRIETDEYAGQPWLVVINALQRARELTEEISYDGTGSPQQDLLTILTDGADVGVHLVVTADAVETVERRLGSGALSLFGARLVGQCSADASQRLLGSAAASRLGPAYALLDEPDDHRRETVRPFPVPDPNWVTAATQD